MKKSADIRKGFIRFFSERGYLALPPAPLVPEADETLLFTNAGMNPFKEFFLDQGQAPSDRVVTSQPCFRAGGKHNDLDQVGKSRRHHTLFEMLGNFSFGSVKKAEALQAAWEFLTGKEWLGLDPRRLWVTHYEGDLETKELWLMNKGLRPEHLVSMGDYPGKEKESDNFWQMGETGPCGPSTEIFYDYGPEYLGTPPGISHEGDRFVEIWNLVFMQYSRKLDGKLTDLPKLCLDTGMGLERITAVMRGVSDTYRTDLFEPIMQTLINQWQLSVGFDHESLRVLSDHLRAVIWVLWEGILPSNQGRGYVLRRLIRRCILHMHRLGCKSAGALSNVVAHVEKHLPWPQEGVQKKMSLEACQTRLRDEEEKFNTTLVQGLKHLDGLLEKGKNRRLEGEAAFFLYDTYGFPVELTAEICEDRGFRVDLQGFKRFMEEQRTRSQSHQKFKTKEFSSLHFPVDQWPASQFLDAAKRGFQQSVKVVGVMNAAGQPVASLEVGAPGLVVLDRTPFYAEGGGQLGDRGWIHSDASEGIGFEVQTTKKIGQYIAHLGVLRSGALFQGAEVWPSPDWEKREACARHHSAVHLLHAALREQWGTQITPAGSSVTEEGLTLDLSGLHPLSEEELDQIAAQVNLWIQRNLPVHVEQRSLREAKEAGVLAFFEDRYGERVRVVSIGEVSKELCGGTHVAASGEILYFRILSESSISQGVRRIRAVAGTAAIQAAEAERKQLRSLMTAHQVKAEQLLDSWEKLVSKAEEWRLAYQELERRWCEAHLNQLNLSREELLSGVVLAVPVASERSIKVCEQRLMEQGCTRICILALKESPKGSNWEETPIQVYLSMTQAGKGKPTLQAREGMKQIVEAFSGKGGGNAEKARGSLNLPWRERSVLEDWVKRHLSF